MQAHLVLLVGLCGGSNPPPPPAPASCASLSPATCPAARCAATLAAALQACSIRGGGTVRLGAGTYHLNDSSVAEGQPMLALAGLSNTALVGSAHPRPTTLLIHGYRTAMLLRSGSNLHFENIDIDMARLPYTFGVARAVTSRSFVLSFDSTHYPGFSGRTTPDWLQQASSIMGFDTVGWRMASDPVVDAQGSFQLTPRSNSSVVVVGAGALNGIRAGHSYVLRHRQLGCAGFCFSGCSNVTLRNTTTWSVAGVAHWFAASRDVSMLGVGVRRRPGRPMSSTADASHFDSCGGDITLEDVHFEGQGDDGMNVHGQFHSVRALDPEVRGRATLGSKPSVPGAMSPLSVGGMYEFRNRRNFSVECRAKLLRTRIVNTSGGTAQQADFMLGSGESFSQHALLVNLATQPSVLISNSYFGNNRARGALLKTSNVLVQGTTFDHTAAHCVLAYPDGCFWFEANGFTNWTLQNNTMIGCGAEATQADIFVAACAPSWQPDGQPLETANTGGPVTVGQPFANLTIRGNRFVQRSPSAALQLFGTNGLTLVGNEVELMSHQQQQVPAHEFGQAEHWSISGHLDGFDVTAASAVLHGWAVDRARSSAEHNYSSLITITIDGKDAIAPHLANLPRPDLVPRIAARPLHGFVVTLPQALSQRLLQSGNHTLVVSAIHMDGSRVVLSGCPACVGPARPTCGVPPDWRGVHPQNCLCGDPLPSRFQVSNSVRCRVAGNLCDGRPCAADMLSPGLKTDDHDGPWVLLANMCPDINTL